MCVQGAYMAETSVGEVSLRQQVYLKVYKRPASVRASFIYHFGSARLVQRWK